MTWKAAKVFGPSIVDQSLRVVVQKYWSSDVFDNPSLESIEGKIRSHLDDLLRHIRDDPDWLGGRSIEARLLDASVREKGSMSDLAGILNDAASQYDNEAPYGSLLFSARLCWMVLPADQRNIQSLEQQLRRLIERILANNRQDATEFRFESIEPR